MAETRADGALRWREAYTPYGEALEGSGLWNDRPGFTGHVRDRHSGLTYMQARYYDPAWGRFLASDPVGFQEGGTGYFGRYHYAAGDPVNMWDPDGRRSFSVGGRANFAVLKAGFKIGGKITFDTQGSIGVSGEVGYRAGGRAGLGISAGTSQADLSRGSLDVGVAAKGELSAQVKVGTASVGPSVEAGATAGLSTDKGPYVSTHVGAADDIISVAEGTNVGLGFDVGGSAGVSATVQTSANIPDAARAVGAAVEQNLGGMVERFREEIDTDDCARNSC